MEGGGGGQGGGRCGVEAAGRGANPPSARHAAAALVSATPGPPRPSTPTCATIQQAIDASPAANPRASLRSYKQSPNQRSTNGLAPGAHAGAIGDGGVRGRGGFEGWVVGAGSRQCRGKGVRERQGWAGPRWSAHKAERRPAPPRGRPQWTHAGTGRYLVTPRPVAARRRRSAAFRRGRLGAGAHRARETVTSGRSAPGTLQSGACLPLHCEREAGRCSMPTALGRARRPADRTQPDRCLPRPVPPDRCLPRPVPPDRHGAAPLLGRARTNQSSNPPPPCRRPSPAPPPTLRRRLPRCARRTQATISTAAPAAFLRAGTSRRGVGVDG